MNGLRYGAPYYPDIKKERNLGNPMDDFIEYRLSTNLRVKGEDNKYRTQLHSTARRVTATRPAFEREDYEQKIWDRLYKDLMMSVYLQLLYGKVDISCKDISGEGMFPIDNCQLTERERLKL